MFIYLRVDKVVDLWVNVVKYKKMVFSFLVMCVKFKKIKVKFEVKY